MLSAMKTTAGMGFFLVFFLSFQALNGQQNCIVLKPEISGSYNGKCRNGLAHGNGIAVGPDRYEGQFIKGLPEGKGTYNWATGETYTGYWTAGKRDGEGEYTFFYNGKDSTIYGTWLNDNFLGPLPKKPVVISKTGVDRYSIAKNGTIKNRVLINIYQNGVRNTGITNLMLSSSSGYDTSIGLSIGYDEVSFPVKLKITYTTWNKLKTGTYFVEFECEIFEPGDWKVDLHN
jgi:hypothetical protein